MLKAEVSVPVALATGAVVIGTYSVLSPPMADVRTVPTGTPGEAHLAGSERTALLVSAGIAGAISLIAKDPVPFWIGAGLAVALSWIHRYSRAVDPMTSKLPRNGNGVQMSGMRYQVEAAG
jgi:hypothetical protein